MDKATVIVEHAQASLVCKSDVVVLKQADGTTHRVGIKAIKQILIKADTWLSSQFMEKALKAGISLVIFPARYGESARHIFAQPSGILHVRLAQYKAYLDPVTRLAIARTFVVAKLHAQEENLRSYGLNFSLQHFIIHANECTDVASLIGIEGASGAHYFKHFAQLLSPQWSFHGRNRRPPRDPVNALLSLSYMLACHVVGRLSSQDGYEIALGFLHSSVPGRPSLALDLVEPLRPRIDAWVVRLCNSDAFAPTDFTLDAELGCRLKKQASRRFYNYWYGGMETECEQLVRIHLAQLRTVLGIGEPHQALDAM